MTTNTKRTALFLSLLIAAACGTGSSTTRSVPGHAAISVQVDPNPIRATPVSGDTYEFPFDVIVRETGGHPVNVTRITVTVNGPGGFEVARESYDADRIRAQGFRTDIPANGELRYHFAPRKEVPDERLFGGVSARLTVDATDDSGAPASASTNVTITR